MEDSIEGLANRARDLERRMGDVEHDLDRFRDEQHAAALSAAKETARATGMQTTWNDEMAAKVQTLRGAQIGFESDLARYRSKLDALEARCAERHKDPPAPHNAPPNASRSDRWMVVKLIAAILALAATFLMVVQQILVFRHAGQAPEKETYRGK